ncbi:MAG: hypothetical protein U0324_33325 [Polyangiales bacterium]
MGAPVRASLSLLLAVACSEPAAPAPDPADAPFAALSAGVAIELVPTAPAVRARCAAELAATYCAPADALAAARACRARLTTEERDACDPALGCAAPYTPTRPGPCVAGPAYAAPGRCMAPVEDGCAFYRACLEGPHACGATGYALGFGEPLCYLFVQRRGEFSAAGQRWLRGVRTCLQRTLVELAARPSLTCDALADAAYASHAGCYTAAGNSYCDLPPEDMGRLAVLLRPYFSDPRVTAQIRAVTDVCARASP